MKFKKKYEEKKYSFKSSLAFEIGSIAHKGKELVAKALIEGDKPDYEHIKWIVENGCTEHGNTRNPRILGTKELKEKYFFDWIKTDDKSGLTYEEKLEIFFNALPLMEIDTIWKPIAIEMPFEFTYNEKYLMHGFIDKIDQNNEDDLRVVDYKSSKKVFDEKEIKTPLQMVIYDMAVQNKFNKTPIEHIYDFIFLGKEQRACSKGYLKLGQTKLDKLFDKLQECRHTGIYTPKPSPLCRWCEFCETNPDADEQLKYECQYHSLWTPSNKTFEVKKKFEAETEKKTTDFWF
jgi:hypothetical protein